MITEEKLEQLALDWFRKAGYVVEYGPDIAPESDQEERSDYADPILRQRLKAAIQRLNPELPGEKVEEVSATFGRSEFPSLEMTNRAMHRAMVDGVRVEVRTEAGARQEDVAFIDFRNPANNEFLAVNQYTMKGPSRVRRPDIVLFINGLPVGLIELKNPADEDADITKAFDQIQTYKNDIPDLFHTNTACVISDGGQARVGSLTANLERFMPWRTLYSEDDQPALQFELEKVVKGFFDKTLFLDYLRHFVLFEQDGDRLIKKIAAYHQFHAVREAVKATLVAARKDGVGEKRADYADRVEPGSGKAGVIWHTQGSGKSISMACYAGKLLQQPEMNNPTLVIVTDRNDLDGQLYETFCAATDLLKEAPVQANGRDELRRLLDERPSGGIIFTTIQKFSLTNGEERHPLLNKRSNIVVISDEAHRSQYGLDAKLDRTSGRFKYGYARHLRDALQNATFIGFTGTPISAEDKDTRAVFGEYVSIYDIEDAVKDGATVPIYYESRLAKLDVNQDVIDELEREVDEIFEDDEDVASREKAKSTWTALEKLVGAEPRLRQVSSDLVSHFEERDAQIPGKAMIVAMSREICVRLYNQITALRPDWHDDDPEKGAIKVIMTGSASDESHLQPHLYSKQTKKRLERRFKDPEDPLKLVIVRDMWLTGFDAPPVHTMYVDKPMRGHNLMQAIARVNRVFKDKPGGLVVDYIGIANELKAALKTYTESQGKGRPTNLASEALPKLMENLDVARGILHGFDYSTYEKEALKLLIPCVDFVLRQTEHESGEDRKRNFLDAVTAMNRAMALCGTLDEAEAVKKEVAFLSAVKAAILKWTEVDRRRSEAERNSALRRILDNSLVSEGVEDVFALAGLEKPNISLLDERFLEDVRHMEARNLAVELLEKLLKGEIKARLRQNMVREKKYSERLLESIRKYRNRAIETAQVIEELIDMAREMRDQAKHDQALGLNPDEIAFYDALAENESAVRELGDEILKKIAHEVTEKLRNSTVVDWQKRESVRARLRILVRRTLRKWKYPPDKQDAAVELVMSQAEKVAEGWS